MIGSDVALLIANKIEDDVMLMSWNFIKEGHVMKNEIKELDSLCRKINEDVHVAVCKIIRDVFFLASN